MSDAISDTGPILHLHEIQRLATLAVFDTLEISDLVEIELRRFDLTMSWLEKAAGRKFVVSHVEPAVWEPLLASSEGARLQAADAQVAALASLRASDFVILTDDMALRKLLERRGRSVAGTVGVLVRAYRSNLLGKNTLVTSIEKLFSESTLHTGPGFRRYVLSLLEGL
ncbi:MAG: hypothetical protein HC897_17200 [Thermoanaerobaculia bacterium]|nr:hypothetical protein [Thermoanaerobaculia bacterium]